MGGKASEGQEDPTLDKTSIEKPILGLGRFKNLWGDGRLPENWRGAALESCFAMNLVHQETSPF